MKRITLYVISIHFLFILWMALWMPHPKKAFKPIQVRTLAASPSPIKEVKTPSKTVPMTTVAAQTSKQNTPKPKSAKLQQTPKAPIKKSAPLKQTTTTKKVAPVIPSNLLQDLQESIAKIDEKGHKLSPSQQSWSVPKSIPELKIDAESTEEADGFVTALVQFLQHSLELPEAGAVKVKLTLKNDGTFVEFAVLQTESERNQEFLQQELKSLKYPVFKDHLKDEKEHTFIIEFCNSP